MELPESALPRCIICEKPIDRLRTGVLHEITGFERDRSAGGTNHVVGRERTGRVVGLCCAYKVQSGRIEQVTLEV